MAANLGVVKSNVTLKQGYLFIKRERNGERITSRALTKPWQRAYFILYCDPIFFEEYKDASLKARKHIHILQLIKHVGPIKTSKSKRHAFQIIEEKTSLVLACENQSLLEEWVRVFTDVMTTRIMQSKVSLKENQKKEHREFTVDMVETTLSGMNDLHGEYITIISSTRMYLLDCEDKSEVLSWPLIHIAIHRCEASQRRILLVMGKNCHFGNGELILATAEYAQMMNVLTNSLRERTKVRSSLSNLTSPDATPVRQYSTRPKTKPRNISEEDEKCILANYQIPNSNGSKSFEMENSQKKTNLQRIYSCPNLQNPNLQNPSRKVRSTKLKTDFPNNHGDQQDSCPNIPVICNNVMMSSIEKPDTQDIIRKTKKKQKKLVKTGGISFPETSLDEGYIEPINLPEDKIKRKNETILLNALPESVSTVDGSPSIAETDDYSSEPYLHLFDPPSEVEELHDIIINALANPQKQKNENQFGPNAISMSMEERSNSTPPMLSMEERSSSSPTPRMLSMEERSSSTPRQSPRINMKNSYNQRRVSEPITSKKCSLFDLRHVRSRQNTVSEMPITEGRKQASPRQQHTFSLPKVKSNVRGDVFQSTAEKYLVHSTPKDNSVFFPSNSSPKNKAKTTKRRRSINSRPSSSDMECIDEDTPPPLPIRESPELLQKAQHDLTITIGTSTTRRNTLELDKNMSTITVSQTFLTIPPPIPPKSKHVVSLTNATSISSERGGVEPNIESSKRLSYGEDSNSVIDVNNNTDEDTPPAVPERNYNTRLVKQSKTESPSSSNIHEGAEKNKGKRQSPLASKPPVAKTLNTLSFLPEDKVKVEAASPPPHRRSSPLPPPGTPSTDIILLEGDGEVFPSISITKIMSNEPFDDM